MSVNAPTATATGVIRTGELTKVYPGTDFAAVDGLDLDVRAGRDLRPARPERRGQDDDRRDADHAGDPDLGHGRSSARWTWSPSRRWPSS